MISTQVFAVEVMKAVMDIQEKYFPHDTLVQCIAEILTIVAEYDPE